MGNAYFDCLSVCNYLIAYQITGESVVEAVKSNIYVKCWTYLVGFFACAAIVSFVGFLFMKPKKQQYMDEGMQVFESRSTVGTGPIAADEYVTVRLKRDELSKLQG